MHPRPASAFESRRRPLTLRRADPVRLVRQRHISTGAGFALTNDTQFFAKSASPVLGRLPVEVYNRRICWRVLSTTFRRLSSSPSQQLARNSAMISAKVIALASVLAMSMGVQVQGMFDGAPLLDFTH